MKKYDLIMNCKECNEFYVDEKRVIEYAKNRLIANPNDINDLGFDSEKIGMEQAMYIINFYNEEVKEVTITKDNIHLYYEFMRDEDLQNYSYILNAVIFDRFKTIRDNLKLNIPALAKESLFDSVLDDTLNYRTSVTFFRIKDTLKPIDEYIADIKGSSEYKKYSFKLFSSDSVIVDENGQMVETGIVYAAETVRMATDGSGDEELHLNPGEKLISCTSLDESQQEDLIEELKAQLF